MIGSCVKSGSKSTNLEGEKIDQSECENNASDNAANNAHSAGSENGDNNNTVKEGIKCINNKGKEKTRARSALAGKKTRAQTQNLASEFLPAMRISRQLIKSAGLGHVTRADVPLPSPRVSLAKSIKGEILSVERL